MEKNTISSKKRSRSHVRLYGVFPASSISYSLSENEIFLDSVISYEGIKYRIASIVKKMMNGA